MHLNMSYVYYSIFFCPKISWGSMQKSFSIVLVDLMLHWVFIFEGGGCGSMVPLVLSDGWHTIHTNGGNKWLKLSNCEYTVLLSLPSYWPFYLQMDQGLISTVEKHVLCYILKVD